MMDKIPGGGIAHSEIRGMASKFDTMMQSEGKRMDGKSGGPTRMSEAETAGSGPGAIQDIMKELSQLVQQLGELLKMMSSGKSAGGSLAGKGSSVTAAGGSQSGLGGMQGPSEKIPDPTQYVREIKLGGKTMTVGGDGSSSRAEVDAATTEMQRMYDTSPTFRRTIDSADANQLTVTIGRRGDNTSWGGGGRVFLNLNNIEAGNNDRFQGIVGHEFAHAAAGLGHGAELDAIENRVRAEA